MPIQTIDNWADLGSISEPTTAKKALGWVDGESPPAAYENWVQNDTREKINELVVDSPDSIGHFVTEQSLQMKYYPSGGEMPAGPGLYLMDASDNTKNYVDLITWRNSDGEKKILALDHDGCTIDVFDAETLSLESENDISAGFGVADNAYLPQSMCTDGTYVYVVAVDGVPPSANCDGKIQAFNIATWAVHASWPATGRQMDDAAHNNFHQEDWMLNHVIFANTTTLAVVQSWLRVTGAGINAIQLVAVADGALGLAGIGDSPTGTHVRPTGQIASDGTNLYFSTYDEDTTTSYLCTATIADPTTGLGGIFPNSYADQKIADIMFAGEYLYVTFFNDTTYMPDSILEVHYGGAITHYIEGATVSGGGGSIEVEIGGPMVYDGRYVWARLGLQDSGHFSNVIAKLNPLQPFSPMPITNPGLYITHSLTEKYTAEDYTNSTDYDNYMGRALFDGRDIWYIWRAQTGDADRSGILLGVYRAGWW